MIPDHIIRMEEFSDSYRSEYEKALKYASATAFIGEGLRTRIMIISSWFLSFICTGSAETVCMGSTNGGRIAYTIYRQAQHC